MTAMTASRTRRLLAGVSVGYLNTIVVMVVGLWLTPYLLRHLDQHDYGLWLVCAQMLFYLSLTDVGVVALLPREVAFTTGRGGATRHDDLRQLIGGTTRLVFWQLPIVAVLSFALWWIVAARWPDLAGPFAVVAVTFVVAFPLRVPHAVLQGLQDLGFLGGTQMAAWAGGTLVTIALVEARWRIPALAAGWVTTLLLGAGLAWWGLRRRHPEALPQTLPALSMATAQQQLGRGVWISVSQIAQVMLNGTDLLVIGAVLGPSAVVPYVCTGKLVTILTNQPQLFMQAAIPALSELRTSAPREHVIRVSTSLTQLLLLCSGAMVCVVLAVNDAFVSWWVGPANYAGGGLTALLLLVMLVRHWNASMGYSLFCFGYERRLALTAIGDGVLSLAAMLILVPRLGLLGAAIGALVGTLVISLPFNVAALAREEGVTIAMTLRPLWSWFVRFALISGAVILARAWWPLAGVVPGLVAGAIVTAVYTVVMTPVLVRPPLGAMLAPRVKPWLMLIPGFSQCLEATRRRAASQAEV